MRRAFETVAMDRLQRIGEARLPCAPWGPDCVPTHRHGKAAPASWGPGSNAPVSHPSPPCSQQMAPQDHQHYASRSCHSVSSAPAHIVPSLHAQSPEYLSLTRTISDTCSHP